MIPVLYGNSERAFVTNGIGRLSDCISCIVTEERNGIYECEFEYPITGARYNDIQERCIVAVTHDDTGDIQPFDIYGRTAPIDGIVTFYAHHVSYRLSDVVVEPCEGSNPADAFNQIKLHSINSNPFTFWTDKTGSSTFKVEKPDYARALLGGQQGSILDVYGKGDYEWDKWTVKLYLDRGTDSGVEIRYGKNLSDLKHEIDTSETFNAVVPYWLGSDGTLVMLPEKMLVYSGSPNSTAKFTDEQHQIIRDEKENPIEFSYKVINAKPLDLSSEFQEAPTVEQLRELAQSRLEDSDGWIPDENITVDFVQLWQTEEYKQYAPLQRVRLCDTVSVYYPELGVEAVKQKVIKTVYNVLLDRYDSIELGKPQTTLAQSITGGINEKIDELPTVSMMQEAIGYATDLIRGGLGGYVYMKPNANGQPEEILIMDNPDINQAVNVIRMNKNGIGFSSNGYAGPFKSAWTIDGSFVADFITAGTMSANRIKGGTLTLGGKSNGNGVLEVYDASDALKVRANNDGLYAIKGTIGGLTIADNMLYNNVFELNSAGIYYKYNGVQVGYIGTQHMASATSQRGLAFGLEPTGNYMAWTAKKNASDSSYGVVMLYANKETTGYTTNRLTFKVNTDFDKKVAYNLYIDPNTGGANGGVSGNVTYTHKYTSGSATVEQNHTLTFKNGLLIGYA